MSEMVSPAEQVTRVATLLGRAVLRWKREKEQSSEISGIVSDSLTKQNQRVQIGQAVPVVHQVAVLKSGQADVPVTVQLCRGQLPISTKEQVKAGFKSQS